MNQDFGKEDYEILQTDVLYQGMFRLVKLHLRHRLFNGGWSKVFTREVLMRLPAAAVLPYDPVMEHIILIEQFRPGAIDRYVNPWQIEIPAGIIEQNEKPEDIAIREAEEEAGVKLSKLELICDYSVSPGGSNEYLHIYCGQVDAANAGGIHGLAHEHEDIRVLNISLEEALNKLHAREIKNAPAIIALQWLELNKKSLRQKWLI